jgi:hypothetical protein
VKTIGRRVVDGSSLADQAALARTAAALRGTAWLVPRGVFRFRSFDEAETWMTEMTRRTHARQSPPTSPESAGP